MHRDGGSYPAIRLVTLLGRLLRTNSMNLNHSLLCLSDPTSLWPDLWQGMEGGFSRLFHLSLIVGQTHNQVCSLTPVGQMEGWGEELI